MTVAASLLSAAWQQPSIHCFKLLKKVYKKVKAIKQIG
ncbi:hypothetical protein FB99_22840 [Pantoea agglomerans]|nr:hypothetical protein FB99_22840 [Pantoea agglomerans]